MRYLGLDLGTRTLGTSISDITGTIASSYQTIHFEEKEYDTILPKIKELVQDMLDTMGAVLEQLLIIDREMEQEELFDLCQCMNPYEVVQFHLYKEYMSTGSFVNLCIEDSVIPFVVKSAITIPVEASQERSISIGLYVFIAEEKQQYVTLICDNETGMVIAPITLDEEGMEGLLDDIVEVLEKNNILPSEIYTNNRFAATILEPLYEHYDLDESINGEITDDVYEFFMEQANLDAAKESKH